MAFPDLLAGSIGYVESPTAVADGIDLTTEGVGTGPFTLAEYRAGERAVLEANPDYWGTDEDGTQLPYLDQLTVVSIRDEAERLSALESGEIDIFQTADSGTVKQAEDAASRPRRSAGPAPPSCCSTTPSRPSTTSGPARRWPTPWPAT